MRSVKDKSNVKCKDKICWCFDWSVSCGISFSISLLPMFNDIMHCFSHVYLCTDAVVILLLKLCFSPHWVIFEPTFSVFCWSVSQLQLFCLVCFRHHDQNNLTLKIWVEREFAKVNMLTELCEPSPADEVLAGQKRLPAVKWGRAWTRLSLYSV